MRGGALHSKVCIIVSNKSIMIKFWKRSHTCTFTHRDSNDESWEIIQYPALVGLLKHSYLETQLWIRDLRNPPTCSQNILHENTLWNVVHDTVNVKKRVKSHRSFLSALASPVFPELGTSHNLPSSRLHFFFFFKKNISAVVLCHFLHLRKKMLHPGLV